MDKSSQEIATVNTEANIGKRKKKLGTTKRITYLATLVAASLILKIAGGIFKTPTFTLSLAYIPWILSAIAMGPLGGAVVAGLTDFLGAIIQGFAPNPILSLACVGFGFIMGLVFKIPRLDARIKLLIGTLIVIPVCTLFLNALGMTVYYAAEKTVASFFGYVVLRLPQTLVVAVNAAATAFLFPLMRKLQLMD